MEIEYRKHYVIAAGGDIPFFSLRKISAPKAARKDTAYSLYYFNRDLDYDLRKGFYQLELNRSVYHIMPDYLSP